MKRGPAAGNHQRCACRECLAGDNLPPEYQGWPGAYQLMLFSQAKKKGRKS